MPFPASDVRWLSETVFRVHACATEAELYSTFMPELHARFRSTFSQVEEVACDLSAHRAPCVIGGRPIPPGLLAAFHDSPIVCRQIATGFPTESLHMDLLVPRAQLERTDFFNVAMRFLDLDDQLIAATRESSEAVWSFGVNRDTRFTADERHLFELIRRHAQASFLRIRRSQIGFGGLPDARIVLGAGFRPRGLSPSQCTILAGYFPSCRAEILSGHLPQPLSRWVRMSLAMLAVRPPPRPLTVFLVESVRGRLNVRLFPGQPDGTILLKLSEERRVPDPFALRRAGLTTRECEVLHWICEGKRDSEIAAILGSASRTVGKHVEHLLLKLGVAHRGLLAAAARVRLQREDVADGRSIGLD